MSSKNVDHSGSPVTSSDLIDLFLVVKTSEAAEALLEDSDLIESFGFALDSESDDAGLEFGEGTEL